MVDRHGDIYATDKCYYCKHDNEVAPCPLLHQMKEGNVKPPRKFDLKQCDWFMFKDHLRRVK